MNTHEDKTQQNNSKAIANSLHKQQSEGEPALGFEDNHPEELQMKSLQEMANNSPQVKQLRSYQEMADQSQAQVAQLAKNSTPQASGPVQQNNRTGLPDHLKSGIESLSGYSMDDVKVHYNSDQPAQLKAHAFAQGSDIHLSTGQEKHLPHEAWHVVQQKQKRVQPTTQLKGKANLNDDHELEKEADMMGFKADNTPVQAKTNLIEGKISTGIVQAKLIVGDSKQAETMESLGSFATEQGLEMTIAINKMINSEAEIKVQDLVGVFYYAKDNYGIYDINLFKDTGGVVQEFVTEEHKEAISSYCQSKNMVLSVRDTGKLSLDRVKQGAKPKPHTILEKSIKESSLENAHPEAAAALKSGRLLEVPPMIEGVSLNDLKGFVGHWDEAGKLLGLRVDRRDLRGQDYEAPVNASPHETGITRLQAFLAPDQDNPYIPLLNFAAYKDDFESTWQQFLYTGDYDLHEVYIHNKTLLEGSPEKARALSGINDQIARDQPASRLPIRSGQIEAHRKTVEIGEGSSRRRVPADTLHAGKGSEYAMIQHGDQAGYITNQIHEGRLKLETANLKAQLVGAVAAEAPGPLAWCVRGTWYITNNTDQHQKFRAGLHLTPTSGWAEGFQAAVRQGQSRIVEFGRRKDDTQPPVNTAGGHENPAGNTQDPANSVVKHGRRSGTQ